MSHDGVPAHVCALYTGVSRCTAAVVGGHEDGASRDCTQVGAGGGAGGHTGRTGVCVWGGRRARVGIMHVRSNMSNRIWRYACA
jgi:hypothetical protein